MKNEEGNDNNNKHNYERKIFQLNVYVCALRNAVDTMPHYIPTFS